MTKAIICSAITLFLAWQAIADYDWRLGAVAAFCCFISWELWTGRR